LIVLVDSRPCLHVKPGWMVEAHCRPDGDGRTDIVRRFNSTGQPSPNPMIMVWCLYGLAKDGVIDEVKQRGGAPVS
jgi:hypothetical protein